MEGEFSLDITQKLVFQHLLRKYVYNRFFTLWDANGDVYKWNTAYLVRKEREVLSSQFVGERVRG